MSLYCWRCFFLNDGNSVAYRCLPVFWWTLYPCQYNGRICPRVGLINCVEWHLKAWHLPQTQSKFLLCSPSPLKQDVVDSNMFSSPLGNSLNSCDLVLISSWNCAIEPWVLYVVPAWVQLCVIFALEVSQVDWVPSWKSDHKSSN